MFPRIVAADYETPSHASPGCAHLLGRILTADPAARITAAEIGRHPWFLEALPPDLAGLNDRLMRSLIPAGLQSVAEIEAVVRRATCAEDGSRPTDPPRHGGDMGPPPPPPRGGGAG